MKNLFVCTSFLLLSSMALATGLDCTKTVAYPSPDGSTPGPVTTHTYQVEMTNNQAFISALSPDSENNLIQSGERFEIMANYSNGTYNPLRIVDVKLDTNTKITPVVDAPRGSTQNTLQMTSTDGFTINLVCKVNPNE